MEYLGFKDLLDLARELSGSQGFYSRLYRDLLQLDKEDIQTLDEEIKKHKFTDTLDLILWLEC